MTITAILENRLTFILILLSLLAIGALLWWRNFNLLKKLNRKAADLENTSSLTQTFFENIPDILYVSDIVGRLIYANKATQEINNMQREESIAGVNSDEFLESDSVVKLQVHTQEVIHEKKAIEQYYSIKALGREARDYRALKFPLLDKNGEIYAVGTIGSDVTHRTEAEKALQESENLFKAVFESVNEAILLINTDGYIKLANHQAEELFGYTVEKLQTMNIIELMPDSKIKRHDELSQIFLSNPTATSNIEFEFMNSDKSTFPTELGINPVYTSDGRMMVSCVIHDMTDTFNTLKELENNAQSLMQLNLELEKERTSLEIRVRERTRALLKERQLAESSNRAKSLFLATMSHEIRTPMNGIIGTVDILGQSKLGSEQEDQVEIIKYSAKNLLMIIDNILDFSKIEADKIILDEETINLSELIIETCKTIIPVANTAGVSLSFYREPDLAVQVIVDPVRIKQVLINLLSNAIKFSTNQHTPGAVSLRAFSKDAKLCFEVKDNGIGIAEHSKTLIFDPFSQADSSTTRRYGGTGLGLPICKRLAELMEGEIAVESEERTGSTFTFSIPLKTATDKVFTPASKFTETVFYILSDNEETNNNWTNWLQFYGAKTFIIQDINQINPKTVDYRKTKQDILLILNEHTNQNAENELTREMLNELKSIKAYKTVVVHSSSDNIPANIEHGIFYVTRHSIFETTFSDLLSILELPHELPGQNKSAEPSKPEFQSTTYNRDGQSKAHILVVEDNEINQKVIANQLEFLNYSYKIAENGTQALKMLYQEEFSMVLTDLHMPSMDGYELTNAIRHQEGDDQHLPIVACTANATKGENTRCLNAGMDEYLVKPVSLNDLSASLAKWTNQEQHLDIANSKASQSISDTISIDNNIQKNNLSETPTEELDSRLAVLDITILSDLIGNNNELIIDFLNSYVDSANTAKQKILKAAEKEDCLALEREAHMLKSSSSSIGALCFANTCINLEALAKQNESFEISELMHTFNSSFEDLMHEISQWRNQHG
tara:strand:+ start:657 stop:3695 length:3039 start_codon:yes stop_codon:yes gene_type:complete